MFPTFRVIVCVKLELARFVLTVIVPLLAGTVIELALIVGALALAIVVSATVSVATLPLAGGYPL